MLQLKLHQYSPETKSLSMFEILMLYEQCQLFKTWHWKCCTFSNYQSSWMLCHVDWKTDASQGSVVHPPSWSGSYNPVYRGSTLPQNVGNYLLFDKV